MHRVAVLKSTKQFVFSCSPANEGDCIAQAVRDGYNIADIEEILVPDLNAYINANFPKTKEEQNAPILAQLGANDKKAPRMILDYITGASGAITFINAHVAKQGALRARLVK